MTTRDGAAPLDGIGRYTLIKEPCSPYPRPTWADLKAAPMGDRSVDRRARWLRRIVQQLNRDELEQLALTLATHDQLSFEQELAHLEADRRRRAG